MYVTDWMLTTVSIFYYYVVQYGVSSSSKIVDSIKPSFVYMYNKIRFNGITLFNMIGFVGTISYCTTYINNAK